MNERIRELAKQAGYLPDGFGVGHWDMPECKKFAELIVLECEKILIEKVEVALDASGNPVSPEDFIKQHFGVE